MNADVLGQAVGVIFKSAFTARAVGGGFIGSTIATACRYGFARGLFSNESGMGSAPLVASAARTRNPKRQALVSMTGTFWDTVVICLMTGLVLVSCIIKYPHIDGLSGDGSVLTSQAFSMIPGVGLPVLVVGLVTFAFSLSNVNGKLGFFEYMISTIGAVVPASLLPCMTFLLVALATFATAGYWSMQVISVPIFLPLASALGVNPSIIVAAIMSGVTFGCCYCFYSDNIFMTAAGSQVSNLRQTKTGTSYLVPCAVISFILYLSGKRVANTKSVI
jgi:Na+/alanine symporter